MKRVAPALALALLPIPMLAQGIPPNAISSLNHYRESGIGHANGRAGSAQIAARTLLGKDGYTTVEITTGTLDSSTTPPGNLDKVQFKPLDEFGNAMYSQNFTGLTGGGYYSFTTNVLAHKEQVQLQANASGIDRNRTDVVTLIETVKYRPDIAVQNLMFPSQAIVNSPVNISANLVELNGDTGATTTCNLYVDGTSVDEANNVWVDAGGSVSCVFTYTFASIGSHTIQVAAENVTPSDWDTSNNSASGTIQINPALSSYVIQYSDSAITNTSSSNDSITMNGTPVYVLNETQSASGWMNSSYAQGGFPGSAFQQPIAIQWNEFVDGNVAFSRTGTQTSAGSSACAPGTCFYASGDLDGGSFFVNGYQDSTTAYTLFVAMRKAGDVTYLSQGFECAWWFFNTNCQTGSYYTWNTSSHTAFGTRVGPPSSTWGVNIGFTDSTNTSYSMSLTIDVSTTNTTSISGTNPCTPRTWSDGTYTYNYCDYQFNNNVVVSGYAFQP